MFFTKKEVASALLRNGNVFIHLDPRKEGVAVPPRLKLQSQLVLQVGWDMPVPIPDLSLDDEGLYATLSFKGVPFTCFLPWRAIFAVVGEDAKGITWKEDMPTEIKEEMEKTSNKEDNKLVSITSKDIPKKDVTTKSGRKILVKPRHLRLVK